MEHGVVVGVIGNGVSTGTGFHSFNVSCGIDVVMEVDDWHFLIPFLF
jgi:hypothetical protein